MNITHGGTPMTIQRTFALISILLLTACGGGGGGSAPATPATQTVVKGVASKGLITNGTVNIYALNTDGSKGALLGTGTTDGNGAYSISCGSYSGPVVVEASGSYLDEATGQTKTVPASAPLRAALPSVTGTVSLPVTPLTDLAVRQAGPLTAQSITAANTLISATFKVDIINTMPAAPTTAAFQSNSTTQAQKDYALVLAAVSQQMSTSGSDLATTLTTINSGISSTGMDAQTAATITAAATTFVTTNPNNQTSVTTMTGSTLQTIGAATMKLTVALQGNNAATVKGIQATITLPNGATLRAVADGTLASGVVTARGSAASASIEGKYTAATATDPATVTLGLISSSNLSAGDIIELTIDVAAGATAPSASAYIITASTFAATGGVTVSGASVVLR
jgi:hypothetical protein